MVIVKGSPMLADDINNLTFFPKGTILTFSSDAWNATGEKFKEIWKICDGQNGTPRLIDKFLRGGESSGETGGSATVSLTKENLPKHEHEITDPGHTHTVSTILPVGNSGCGATYGTSTSSLATSSAQTGIKVKDTFLNQTQYAEAFGIEPPYYSVIYIMKIV